MTEMVVLCILAAHVRSSDTLRPRLLVLALSCSCFHILEIFSMEYRNFFAGNYKVARNLVLLLGDVSTSTAVLLLIKSSSIPCKATGKGGRAGGRQGDGGGAGMWVMWGVAGGLALSLVFRIVCFDLAYTRI